MVDRSSAGAFASVADSYERARPDWPPEAIDGAFAEWGLDPKAGLVVDVAAGTGRLTTLLAQRGREVLAVEPLVQMRRHIRDAPALRGSAEQIPLRDGAAQAIFVGEAFHWFDHDAALAEFARVLRPGGGLALLWNTVAGDDPQPWQGAVGNLLAALPASALAQSAASAAFRDPGAAHWREGPAWEPFEPVRHREFRHTQVLDREGLVELVASWSFVAALEAELREGLLADVGRELADAGVELARVPWRCDLYLSRRR